MDHNTLIDVFFTLTAAAVIVITIFLAVLAIYAISIVRTIRRLVRTAEFTAELLKDGVSDLRDNIKRRGFTTGVLAGFLRSLRRGVNNKRK